MFIICDSAVNQPAGGIFFSFSLNQDPLTFSTALIHSADAPVQSERGTVKVAFTVSDTIYSNP